MKLVSAMFGVLALSTFGEERLLTEESYAETRDAIVPCADELKWMDVGWRPTFWEGVAEAQRDKKPVLLWAMNGHPLACT